MIIKRVVKLKPTKYASELDAQYYKLFFFEIKASKTLNIVLKTIRPE